MHRSKLLQELACYQHFFPKEKETTQQFLSFVSENRECFSRKLAEGHITGSAWIINRTGSLCLLIHHKKLDRWLQPGGHADGCTDVQKVALKEAQEETGLKSLQVISTRIFDLDIHRIPARKMEPAHFHYDVRYLFIADTGEAFCDSPEIKNIAWFDMSTAADRSERNESILRMIQKTAFIGQ